MARREAERPESELNLLRAALAREERISRALREVGNALGTTLDLDDLLELILSKLTDLLEADRSTLYLLDEASGDLVSRIVVGQQVRSIRLKVGHGIAGMVAKTGKPIRVADAYRDPRFEQEWDLLTGFRTKSMLVVPLKNHLGRTIGVIQVLNKRTLDEFTFEDEAILAALSTQAAVAIDNSRLFLSLIQKNRLLVDTKVQLEHRVKDLELLFELERSTGRAASVDELVLAALKAAVKASDARGAALLFADEGTGDLVEYVHDPERGGIDRFSVKSGEGFLARSVADVASLRVEGVKRGVTPWSERVEGRFGFAVESVAALPLEGDDGTLGALGVFTRRDGLPWSDQDMAVLALVSANVSTAVRLFRASEAREKSERLTSIGRLLSQVIHDFKTPMTVISGYVQLLTKSDDQKKRAAYAKEILKQFDVVASMQREVLEFARGERNVFVRKVYMHKFMDELRQQIEREIDGKFIRLDMRVDTKVVARFDEARMARAIHNLARNAIEAMGDRGGCLTIESGLDDSDLRIVVSDEGPGIPQEVQGRLFQSFVTAGKKGGTGLGLAIVKKIVDEHGGTVTATSSSSGTRFELRIPQADGQAPKSSGPATEPRRTPRLPAAKSTRAAPARRKGTPPRRKAKGRKASPSKAPR